MTYHLDEMFPLDWAEVRPEKPFPGFILLTPATYDRAEYQLGYETRSRYYVVLMDVPLITEEMAKAAIAGRLGVARDDIAFVVDGPFPSIEEVQAERERKRLRKAEEGGWRCF